MLYPNTSAFIMGPKPHIDLYQIERQVKKAFEGKFGQGEILTITASQYPSEIGVTLFLKHYDKEKVLAFQERVEEAFAAQGLRVGILALSESELVAE